ncbi:5-oxoprolinase [Neoconidiobolus thromboides FSU 785]|nr:5-oxoprolinase [Neoconidiobolus thromboides FSU 785]
MKETVIQKVRISIDRGGTFTDCFACWEEKIVIIINDEWTLQTKVIKLLSQDKANYEDAPTEGIRRLLSDIYKVNLSRDEKINLDKIESIRMGTTVATNALLERQGERLGLITTSGFKDVLEIGTQARPNIFDLKCIKPSILYEKVIEVDERITIVKEGGIQTETGDKIVVEKEPELKIVEKKLKELLESGIKSVAICFVHSYLYDEHEQIVGQLAKRMGFENITLSSDTIKMIKYLPRTSSACVDGYLTPHIQNYIKSFSNKFEGEMENKLLFMQSDGGLSTLDKFSGLKAILSGPAGGVIGYSKTSYNNNLKLPIIGFDMGGTSTDVSRFDGNLEHVFESNTGGVIIQSPQLEISTVAAGGGSKLVYQRGLFQVGPSSVGASPGPVCYRKGGALAVTDANLLLGRLIPELFPKIFGPKEDEALDYNSTYKAFEKVQLQINNEDKVELSVEDIAYGFIKVANEAMARPIRGLTENKGWDTSKHILCCFGGAGGQHACSIANLLGIKMVLIHKYSSILSAYGLSLAEIVYEQQQPTSYPLIEENFNILNQIIQQLKEKVKDEFNSKGINEDRVEFKVYFNLRYDNTDCSLMILMNDKNISGFEQQFNQSHLQQFGFLLKDKKIIVDDIRVSGIGKNEITISKDQELTVYEEIENCSAKESNIKEKFVKKVYFENGWLDTKVYLLNDLNKGDVVVGPALIVEPNSANLIEPNWLALISKDHIIIKKINNDNNNTGITNTMDQTIEIKADPIKLSIFSNRFMAIAEQMGRTLQKTSVSTNIKERLDFSCALFGPEGGLIANAPHIPVHLGSLSFAVKWQIEHYNELSKKDINLRLKPGDVIVTNHPVAGGSHLPDITVITPVFYKDQIVFFVANRAHHADIGGILPGSMPPNSKYLSEEGASILSLKLVEDNVFQYDKIRDVLVNQPKLNHLNSSGTRCWEDNLSDLKAQVAANNIGIQLVNQLINDNSLNVVLSYMKFIRQNANSAVRSLLKKFIKEGEENRILQSEDFMDDGSRIKLKIIINKDGSAEFNFDGTTEQVYNNFNAPKAVTHSAILYCLRCLIDEAIPLNSGCLEPISIIIPDQCLLNPSPEAAVVGGNVTTSQRVCDTIFKAFNAAAASQGCCNNLTFGDATFGYYETIAGGSGAGPSWNGQSGVHVHMTNTRITDVEILEKRYPVILREFGIREGSGGLGQFNGGNGVKREVEFLKSMDVNILSERRARSPYGLNGGLSAQPGQNLLIKKNGLKLNIGGKASVKVEKGDRVIILTPGGGGFGTPDI